MNSPLPSSASGSVPNLVELAGLLLLSIVVMLVSYRPLMRAGEALAYPMVTSRAHLNVGDPELGEPSATFQRLCWTVQNVLCLWVSYAILAVANGAAIGFAAFEAWKIPSVPVLLYGALVGLAVGVLIRLTVHLASTELARALVYDMILLSGFLGIALVAHLRGYDIGQTFFLFARGVELTDPWLVPGLMLVSLLAAITTEFLVYGLRYLGFLGNTTGAHVEDLVTSSRRVRLVVGYGRTVRQIASLVRGRVGPAKIVRWVTLTGPAEVCDAIKDYFDRSKTPVDPDHLRIIVHAQGNAAVRASFPEDCVRSVDRRIHDRLMVLDDDVAIRIWNVSMRTHDHFVPRANVSVYSTSYQDVLESSAMFDDWWKRLEAARQPPD